MKIINKYKSNEDGNIAVAFAGSIGAVLLGVAVVVDLNFLFSKKQNLQDALDVATLAATQVMYSDANMTSAEIKEKAAATGSNVFAKNLRTQQIQSYDVNFDVTDEKITGTVSAVVPLEFNKLLNRESQTVNAKSVARYAVPGGSSPCIMALSKTRAPGMTLNSGAKIQSSDCEVHVHSTSNPAFTINSGVIYDVASTCIAGSNITDNHRNVDDLNTNCVVASDPYAGQIPVPDSSSCDYSNANYNDSQITMQPGVYCGWFNFNNSNAEVDFEPGLYVLKNGGWNVNGGKWEGEGVTFYFADSSKIQFNSGVDAEFSAPSSGPYKDVFITETAHSNPDSLWWNFILNDAKGFDFDGLIYLPNRQFIMNSGSNTTIRRVGIYANSIMINSTSLVLEAVPGASGSSGYTLMSEGPLIVD